MLRNFIHIYYTTPDGRPSLDGVQRLTALTWMILKLACASYGKHAPARGAQRTDAAHRRHRHRAQTRYRYLQYQTHPARQNTQDRSVQAPLNEQGLQHRALGEPFRLNFCSGRAGWLLVTVGSHAKFHEKMENAFAASNSPQAFGNAALPVMDNRFYATRDEVCRRVSQSLGRLRSRAFACPSR